MDFAASLLAPPAPAGMPLRVRAVHATDAFVLLPPEACNALLAQQPALPLVLQLSAERPPERAGEPRSWYVPLFCPHPPSSARIGTAH
jgi:hypothetical protein